MPNSACSKARHELGYASALRGVRARSRFVGFVVDAFVCLCWIRAAALVCEWSSIALSWSIHQHVVDEATAALEQNETEPEPNTAPTPETLCCPLSRAGHRASFLACRLHGGHSFAGLLTFKRLFQRDELWHLRTHTDGEYTFPRPGLPSDRLPRVLSSLRFLRHTASCSQTTYLSYIAILV